MSGSNFLGRAQRATSCVILLPAKGTVRASKACNAFNASAFVLKTSVALQHLPSCQLPGALARISATPTLARGASSYQAKGSSV